MNEQIQTTNSEPWYRYGWGFLFCVVLGIAVIFGLNYFLKWAEEITFTDNIGKIKDLNYLEDATIITSEKGSFVIEDMVSFQFHEKLYLAENNSGIKMICEENKIKCWNISR